MSVDTGSFRTTRPAVASQAVASPGAPESSQVAGRSDARKLLDTLASVIAPSTLITALAFFFGAERQRGLASQFGIDPSLLGFSVQDYLVRSVDPLFPALLVVALCSWWH